MVRLSRRQQFWILLISLALCQVAASVFMRRGAALTISSDLIQGTLLFAGTAAFLVRTRSTPAAALHERLFWILMSLGMTFWLVYQGMWNYFEVIKRQDVPDPFLGDIVLFLHLVPMIAALAVLPHLRGDERDERIRMLDFTLLVTWWLFTYAYVVIPWQTVLVDEPTYSTDFNFAYLTEKAVLLATLASLAYFAHGGWRRLYLQLLGAGTVYAFSSYFANWAIGRGTYYSGSIYDIPLTTSVAWMAAIPSLAAYYDLSDAKPSRPLLGIGITRLSMLALCTLPWAALHAELDPQLPAPVKKFRVLVTLAATVVLGAMIFWRQRLLGAELSYFLDKSRRSFDDLKAVQAQLIQSEKLASLGQLVGGAAHEINNPLTAMLGYSDLLSASSLPPGAQQHATNIAAQVRRTKTLVTSLLTFARHGPCKLGAVDANSVLQTALRLLAPQMQARSISTRLELGTALPAVLADSNQIMHVYLHLAGQVCAQCNPAMNASLCIRSLQDGNCVVTEFSTSFGTWPRTPYGTLLTATSDNKPSSLGLRACCRIVEEHGGCLWQASNAGVPAFRLELPMASKSAKMQSSWVAAHSGV